MVITIYSESQGANFCTFENKILNISSKSIIKEKVGVWGGQRGLGPHPTFIAWMSSKPQSCLCLTNLEYPSFSFSENIIISKLISVPEFSPLGLPDRGREPLLQCVLWSPYSHGHTHACTLTHTSRCIKYFLKCVWSMHCISSQKIDTSNKNLSKWLCYQYLEQNEAICVSQRKLIKPLLYRSLGMCLLFFINWLQFSDNTTY